MVIYYFINTKEWFSRENTFTLGFLYSTISVIGLIISVYLTKYLSEVRGEKRYRLNNFENSFWGYTFSREYRETNLQIFTFSLLYINIFICIYTMIGFYNFLVR